MVTLSKVEPCTPKTGGRQRGTPNRATFNVRQAIAIFAQENAHRLQKWLDRGAEDDPAKAAELFLEYHVGRAALCQQAIPSDLPTGFRRRGSWCRTTSVCA
jgi:hypothetical protein